MIKTLAANQNPPDLKGLEHLNWQTTEPLQMSNKQNAIMLRF